MSAPLQQLVLSDNSAEEQLGATIKTSWKSQRKAEGLVEQLGQLVRRKETDVEQLCGAHYNEFVVAVDQLLHVRTDSAMLRDTVLSFASDLRTVVQPLLTKRRMLDDLASQAHNMDAAADVLRSCLNVLELANKVNFQIDNKKYYSALKTLDELQQHHLRHVIQYDFAKNLQEAIPQIRQKIRQSVLAEIRDWFVKVRENSRVVGRLAMEQMSKRGGLEAFLTKQHDTRRSDTNRVLPREQTLTSIISQSAWKSIEALLQANLVLSAQFSLDENDTSSFEAYLHDVIGFFIIESHVVYSTDAFRSRAAVDALWDVAATKLHQSIAENLQNCTNPDHFLRIKELMIVFIQIMEGYNYPVSKLVDVLLTFFETYCELMKNRASDSCIQAIREDEDNPVVIDTTVDLAEMHQVFKYRPPNTSAEEKAVRGGQGRRASIRRGSVSPTSPYPTQLPISFPFSESLLVCCREVKKFVSGFYQFAEGFHQRFGEMDDILKKAVEKLFSVHICGAYDEKVLKSSIKISQIVRTVLNMEVFDQVIVDIEHLMSEFRTGHKLSRREKGGDGKAATTSFVANCQHRFKESRKKAENRLFDVINKKIDEFFESAEYDFSISEPKTTSTSMPTSPPKKIFAASLFKSSAHHAQASSPSPTSPVIEPSPYLMDLISFLTAITSSTLADLSPALLSLIHYSTIAHIMLNFVSLLTATTVKKITPFFIDSVLAVDVDLVVTYVSDIGDSNLKELCGEVIDLVEICKTWCDKIDTVMAKTVSAHSETSGSSTSNTGGGGGGGGLKPAVAAIQQVGTALGINLRQPSANPGSGKVRKAVLLSVLEKVKEGMVQETSAFGTGAGTDTAGAKLTALVGDIASGMGLSAGQSERERRLAKKRNVEAFIKVLRDETKK